MRESVTVITRKGQITVPIEIRRALGLKQGDKVTVVLSDGEPPEVTIKPYESVVDRTYGAFRTKGGPADLKKLRRQFEEAAGRAAAVEGLPPS